MVDVFISYSRQDLDAVARLAKAIQQAGYEVWWDAELPPHKSYGEVITDKIENANAAIVVWSPSARDSEWVRAEADMARSQKKLIQTALGDIMPPLPFNQIQFADLGDWQGEDDHIGWKKVQESLRDLCGERESLGAAAAGAASAAAASPPVAPAPAPSPAPTPASAPSTQPQQTPSSKAPLYTALGLGGVGLLGGGALVVAAISGSGDDDPYLVGDSGNPVALADTSDMPALDDRSIDSAPINPEPAPPPAPVPTQAPPAASGPVFTTASQTFNGALRQGEEQRFAVGLNANTSYRLVAECDMDCSDIDMWLYDENGNMIDEDVLEDDYPILDVTPIRSAEFTVRLQMFACSIEPCGFQIRVEPQ
ncbi:toll/interleukin-1 receptor domain-containing protein [uncultured Erythrobacter sp.]|uniref:toll/interleukin-1 receptor domain-containing protein n=1 Tax=uncultured Erythrobacter sp. TaxID=263913 RepID=UPI002614E65C|nr:toll/interleukin-1 receptor domain-containing protein [uncultured Erythrobacter sp.]